MKTEHPIQINHTRKMEPHGKLICIAHCSDALHQARHVLKEITNLVSTGESIAVLSRTNKELNPIRAALEFGGIPSSVAAEKNKGIPFHRLREFLALINQIKELKQKAITAEELRVLFNQGKNNHHGNVWSTLLDTILAQWKDETHNNATTPVEALDFLYESIQEYQHNGSQENSIYLSTVYAAKGLEFDHVFILGNWTHQQNREKQEEERRPYYVGMTRARKTLTLYELANIQNPHTSELHGSAIKHLDIGALPGPSEETLRQCYSTLDLSSIWIGFPVTGPKATLIRSDISKLQPGEIVSLTKAKTSDRIFINNTEGNRVGALSMDASLKWGERIEMIQSVKIHAIISWRKEFSEIATEECPDEWEVPLIEITWIE